MLRASSEIAVAISVASVSDKPSSSAMHRPLRRAAIRSVSEATGTRTSILDSEGTQAPFAEPLVQVCETALQMRHSDDAHQLKRCNCHLGLTPSNHTRDAVQSDRA